MNQRTDVILPFTTMRTALPHVGFLSLMVFLSVYARLLISPLLVFIQADLTIGPARATRLFLTLSVSYSVAMIGSSIFVAGLMHRRTIALSAMFLGTGLIVLGLAPNLGVMHIGAAIIGAGAGLYPPAGVASATALVADTIRGRALALHETGPNLAFVFAPLAAALVVLVPTWRAIPVASGVFAIAVGVLFNRFSVAGAFYGDRLRIRNITTLFRKPEFWAIMLLFSLAASSTMGVFSILPTYLITRRGYDPQMVNTLIGVSRISGVGMLFLSGILIDRIGVRLLVTIVMAVTGILTVGIGVLPGTAMLVVVFLQPIIITAFFPAVLSAMADLGPPQVRSVAISMLIPTVNIVSGGIFPALMGWLTEVGSVEAGFVFLGVLIFTGMAAAPLLKK